MKKEFILIIAFAFLAMPLFSQTFDNDRMKKDLAVSENVLSTLLSQSEESNNLLTWGRQKAEGEYISDYGVIFEVNSSFWNRFGRGTSSYSLYPDRIRVSPDHSGSDIVIENTRSSKKNNTTSALENSDSLKAHQKKAEEHFIQAAKDFLADYAHLINQLSQNDNVMIRMRQSSGFRVMNLNGLSKSDLVYSYSVGNIEEEKASEIMVEAKVSDISLLRKDQISRDQFMKKVKTTRVERSNEKKADLEMISSMFHRLYQRDLSDTYYTLSNISYSSVKGMGVVFKMKVYSSYGSDKLFFMPSTGEKELSLEERNKKVQELLPKFERGFKENIINYGRSVKSLEADELLIFEVGLTKCTDCSDFPKALKFAVKKSVLDDFNDGNISEEQAVNQVKVTKEM